MGGASRHKGGLRKNCKEQVTIKKEGSIIVPKRRPTRMRTSHKKKRKASGKKRSEGGKKKLRAGYLVRGKNRFRST